MGKSFPVQSRVVSPASPPVCVVGRMKMVAAEEMKARPALDEPAQHAFSLDEISNFGRAMEMRWCFTQEI